MEANWGGSKAVLAPRWSNFRLCKINRLKVLSRHIVVSNAEALTYRGVQLCPGLRIHSPPQEIQFPPTMVALETLGVSIYQ